MPASHCTRHQPLSLDAIFAQNALALSIITPSEDDAPEGDEPRLKQGFPKGFDDLKILPPSLDPDASAGALIGKLKAVRNARVIKVRDQRPDSTALSTVLREWGTPSITRVLKNTICHVEDTWEFILPASVRRQDLGHRLNDLSANIYRYVLVSPTGAYTHPHVDLCASSIWHTLIVGKKYWIITAPTTSNLDTFVDFSRATERDRDMYHPDYLQRLAEYVTRTESRLIVQHAQQTVHLPGGTVHCVLTADKSLSVSGQYYRMEDLPTSSKYLSLPLVAHPGVEDLNQICQLLFCQAQSDSSLLAEIPFEEMPYFQNVEGFKEAYAAQKALPHPPCPELPTTSGPSTSMAGPSLADQGDQVELAEPKTKKKRTGRKNRGPAHYERRQIYFLNKYNNQHNQ